MIPGGSSIRGRVLRQGAAYISFTIVYFPSWLAVGIVISAIVYPNFSKNIAVGFVILSGLAFTGFALFGASFFRKAQLSGSIMVVITLVFAILPAVLSDQTQTVCGILSFLIPSANFTYFITGVATFEAAGKPVEMMRRAHENDQVDTWRLPLYIHWIFLVIQIISLPVLAFATEHAFFLTASPHRKFVRSANSNDPTVTLSGFCKT